jgi:hypothetical protein
LDSPSEVTEYSHFSTYYSLLSKKTERMPNMECGQCHFWYPDDLLPSLGQCQKEDSGDFQKALREDKPSGPCFQNRSLSSEVLCWCRKCRESVPVSEISLHVGHDLYVATAPWPVEETAELTFAGD